MWSHWQHWASDGSLATEDQQGDIITHWVATPLAAVALQQILGLGQCGSNQDATPYKM
jgi:hypothetical protein